MLDSKIKYLISFFKRKKSGSKYSQGALQLHTLPGQNRHQGGQYNQRKKVFLRFWESLTTKKRVHHVQYNGPVHSKKLIFKLVGLATVTLTVLCFVLVGGWNIIFNNIGSLPFFHVSEIVYSGNDTITRDKLREASGITLYQTSLIGLNCAQAEAGLMTVPWVARAIVKKNWPSTVEITIVENVPVALLHSNKANQPQLQYIDKKGVPFLGVRPGADIDFPVITGLNGIGDPIVREKALAEVLDFLRKVNGNNPYLPAQSVSEIHLDRDGEMVMYLVEYPFPIFLGASNTSQKYSRLVQVLKTLYKTEKGKGSISQIEYIQMDYLQDKVLVAQSESG